MSKAVFFVLVLILTMLPSVLAVSIESVNADILRPGESGRITVDIENNFDDTVKNVVFEIDVSGTPFNVVGSSSFAVNKLEEGDDERFAFGMRVSPTTEPGEYQIPYKLSYMIDNEKFFRESAIGVKVTSESIVDFSADVDKPVVGEKAKINFNTINKGLGELRFVSVKIVPDGFTLLSEDNEILTYVPPTASERCSYSRSGSITITSIPIIKLLRTSNLTAYDFPAPDVAKTTMLAFCNENLSNKIKLLLCLLIPYKIPSSLVSSDDMNGNDDAIGEEFMLNATIRSSIPSGIVEVNPCSDWNKTFFV